MLEQEKKDIIVVAREGYSVLLEIDKQMFDINCHEAVNLSKMFSVDVLERCSSLAAHLKDGNLVFFGEGDDLSANVVAPVKIKPLREETAEHIMSQYDQAEKDASRVNMELETRANITAETRKHIQSQVQEGREKILQETKKLTKIIDMTQTTADGVVSPVKERQDAMTSKELMLKVSMDVSPETFAEKQAAISARLEAAAEESETRAEKEIAKQDANEQDANE